MSTRQAPRTKAIDSLLDSLVTPRRRVHTTATNFTSMALVPRTRRNPPRPGPRRFAQAYPFYGNIITDAGRGVGRSAAAGTTSSSILRCSSRSTRRSAIRFRSATRSSSLRERSRAFRATSASRAAIGPRVYIPERYVDETGLVVFGSRAEYETLFKLPREHVARSLRLALQSANVAGLERIDARGGLQRVAPRQRDRSASRLSRHRRAWSRCCSAALASRVACTRS